MALSASVPVKRRRFPDGAEAKLNALTRSAVGRGGVRHAVARVETGAEADGRLWEAAFGQARPDGSPMTAATPFFIASIDKTMTAALVLRRVERGDFDLDAPLPDLLPASLVAGLHRLDGADRTADITVRRLLGHTTGLPDYLEDRPKGGKSLVERLVVEGDREWSVADALALVRDELRPRFAPRSPGQGRPRYSDTNFLLLRAILTETSGRPADEIYRQELFEPLGMRRTWFAGRERPPEAAEAAALWAGDVALETPRALRSLLGVYSTAEDLIRFLRALVLGRCGSPAIFGRMSRQWARFGAPLDRAALRAPGWPIEYGLGLMRFDLPRWIAPFGRPPAVVGHSGSTGTWLFYCPERDLYLAGALDQVAAGPRPFRLMPKMLAALAGAGSRPPKSTAQGT